MNAVFNRAFDITTSDTANFPYGLTQGIYVGSGGDVVVVFEDGSTASFTCAAGQILPVKAKRVNATGTTAALLMALYQV